MTAVDDDFKSFVSSRQHALWRTAWLLTGDAGTAEDLVQTVLVRCWPRWAQLVGGGAEAYVRKALVNEYVSWRRRRWHGEAPIAVMPDRAGADGRDPHVRDAVRTALLTLPPRQRAAVVLRYFDDLTEQQTALSLGCSVGTVKSQTSRALARLREDGALGALLTEGATT